MTEQCDATRSRCKLLRARVLCSVSIGNVHEHRQYLNLLASRSKRARSSLGNSINNLIRAGTIAAHVNLTVYHAYDSPMACFAGMCRSKAKPSPRWGSGRSEDSLPTLQNAKGEGVVFVHEYLPVMAPVGEGQMAVHPEFGPP